MDPADLLTNELAEERPTASPALVQGWRRYLPLPTGLGTEQIGLAVGLAALIVGLSLASPYFFQTRNFVNIGTAIAVTGTMSAVTTVVLISGGLDLSLGSILALSGVALYQALNAGFPAAVAISFALAMGLVGGLVNGTLIVGVGINAFIVTIGTQFVFRGLTYAWSGGGANSELVTDSTISALGSGSLLGVPAPVYVMAAVFLLAHFFLRYTRFGSDAYAIGGNEVAARRAGIRVARVRMTIYCLSALSAALAGILLVGISGASISVSGQGIELTVIAAVVLGGTGLFGGRGTVIGTLLGVLLLGVLNNGLTLLGVAAFWQIIVQGLALLIAVLFDEVQRRRREAV